MPQNGYWIECIPLNETDLYEATICSIPDAKIRAKSPDIAIQKLRDRLASLRHEYCTQGRVLPEHDNPVIPPRGSCNQRGWISVYVQMVECCRNT